MSHNIAQILDGIGDQIEDVNQQITATEAEIQRLTALLPTLQAEIVKLNELKAAAESLSSNNINLNINVNGSHAGTMSTPMQYTANI